MDDEMSKFYEECKEDEVHSASETEADSKSETLKSAESSEELTTQREAAKSPILATETENVPDEISQKNTVEGNSENHSDNSLRENTRYEGSECIYTNPDTKVEYVWSTEMNQWVPRGYKPEFDGKHYKYKDANGVTQRWNPESSTWEKVEPEEDVEEKPKPTYGFDGENHTYTDPKDNTVYIWDVEKNAWFPKVDDDFMARYQLSYGFVDNTTKTEEPQLEKQELKRKAPEPPSWFDMDDQHNTKVYVSNLPLDITEKEFVDYMQKCGLIIKDMKTNKYKVKLYTEPDGSLKGDALCDYIKIESVGLALNVLDGADFRGKRINVQRAKFQMRGDYNPSLKPKKKRKKDIEKERKVQEKLLDWRPDKLRGEREKHERTVVMKNLFLPSTFDEKVELILEYTEDIRTEASKCGIVRKVTLYDKNPEGVATITFSDAEEADICVKFFNNRWFGQRKITAATWDGKTKYKILESEKETNARIDKWSDFLEKDEKDKPSESSNPIQESN